MGLRECKNSKKIVKKFGTLDIPILMFTTNLDGLDGWKDWVEAQDNFAVQSKKCMQIKLECGHNLHYYKFDYISECIKKFMVDLNK